MIARDDENASAERSAKTLEERRASRRAALVAAAADVYGEVGYRSATVRMICRRARLTERYFYESFDSSEALLVEAAVSQAARMHAHLARVRDASGGDASEVLARVLRAYFRALHAERAKARVFTLEIRGIGADADAALDGILDTFAALVVDVADPAGTGPAARNRLLRRGLVGGVLQIAIAWIEGEFREPVELVADAAIRLCELARSG